MPEIAYIRGKIYPIEKAYKVHVEDRGYQYADAVYEVMRYEDGKIIRIYEHLERLRRSLKLVEIPYEFDFEEMNKLLLKIAKKTKYDKVLLYIQISRGISKREHGFPSKCIPEIVITAREFIPVRDEIRKNGIKCITHPDERWKRVDIKTVNLLPSAIARERAKRLSKNDAIFFQEDLEIKEATFANIFIVKDEVVYTPPLNGILEGVTRKEVIGAVKDLKIRLYEQKIYFHDIFLSDEVFISATSIDILPVVEIDNYKIGNGKPGKFYFKIYEKILEKRKEE
jgi:D-alanine transaminase